VEAFLDEGWWRLAEEGAVEALAPVAKNTAAAAAAAGTVKLLEKAQAQVQVVLAAAAAGHSETAAGTVKLLAQ